MRKFSFVSALLALALAVGFAFVACDLGLPGTSGGGTQGGGSQGGSQGGTKEVTSISVTGIIDQTDACWVGETFVPPRRLSVRVTYSDGTSGTITTGYTISADTSTRGLKDITVTHTATGITGTHATKLWVCPTEEWTQTDFYGTWKAPGLQGDMVVTISADSLVVEGIDIDLDGAYSISRFGVVQKSVVDGRPPNRFGVSPTAPELMGLYFLVARGYVDELSISLTLYSGRYDGFRKQ